jgi:hypothetical protein
MPSDLTISVPCPLYLIQFLETLYGKSPVVFPRGSNFNAILDVFLEKQPVNPKAGPSPDENLLIVALPYFEHKDIRSYNYLTHGKEQVFIKELWKFFKITYRAEIAKSICLGLERKDAIELFVEKYNIPLDSWDLLEKDFQRYLKLRQKTRFLRKKSSSVVAPFCPVDSTRGGE